MKNVKTLKRKAVKLEREIRRLEREEEKRMWFAALKEAAQAQ